MSERRPWSPTLALGLIAAVLLAVPWAFKLLSAPGLGEPCGNGFDCAVIDGRCIRGETGRFCTITCESDDECPSAGHCGVPPHDRWRLWFSTSVLSERVCVPGPRPEQPIAVPVAMPGAGEAQFRPPEQRGGLRVSD